MNFEYQKLLRNEHNIKDNSSHYSNKVHFLYLLIFTLLITTFYMNWPQHEENGGTVPTGTVPKPTLLQYKGVVDSMDGLGYDITKRKTFPIDKRYYELENLEECDLTKDRKEILNNVEEIMKVFKNCVSPIIEKYSENPSSLSVRWVKETAICDNLTEFRNLRIDPFPNLHETKWAILPHCKENNTMVTLGVGHDTNAEERLNVTLPNTKFYGADPIIEPNIQLYSAFGQFFPFAVGNSSGMSVYRILPNQNQKTRKYVLQGVTTVEVTYFLKEILGLSRIDMMWIDIEKGAEFEFLEHMHKGEKFDQNNITICQWNVEIHASAWKDGYKLFSKFIKRAFEEGRYMFLRPMETGPGIFRQIYIDMEDEQCIRKYIQ